MKRIWTIVLVGLFVSAPLGMGIAQMYWTPGEESAPSVQPAQPKLDFDRDVLSPSLKDKEIYDYQETGIIEPEEAAPATTTQPAPVPAPRVRQQQNAIEDPLPRRIVPRPSRRERTVTPTPRATRTQPSQPTVTPAEKKQAPTSVTAPADSDDKKKMQWGKVEVKPVEPQQEKKKLQWGKTENSP